MAAHSQKSFYLILLDYSAASKLAVDISHSDAIYVSNNFHFQLNTEITLCSTVILALYHNFEHNKIRQVEAKTQTDVTGNMKFLSKEKQ